MTANEDDELAARHLLGLKELGQSIAVAIPEALEAVVCTPLGEESEKKPLIEALTKKPEEDLTCA